jgi:signal transduction histidine kinase
MTPGVAAPPLPDVDLVPRVRRAALMGATVWALFFAFVLFAHLTLLSLPHLRHISALFAGAVGLNAALAVLAGRWSRWRAGVYIYETVNAVLITLVFAWTGGSLEFGFVLIAYGFLVIHTWEVRPDSSAYLTATVCGLCYASLALAEAAGIAASPLFHHPPTAGERATVAIFGVLSLNALALYASRYSAELRKLGERLKGLVAERTKELADANVELEAKAKALEAKQQELEEFVYRITHDLKTPVNNVLLFADLLLESPQLALSDEVRGKLERIRQGSSRAENMIQDLWRFVRITSNPEAPGWLELAALVSRAAESLEATIDAKGIRLRLGSLPRLWGRENKLGHVVANLLANAVRHVPLSGGEIEVSGRVEDGSALFWVEDNGAGIPEDYHGRIFELYGQVPSHAAPRNGDGGGTGVGLAIVKRIVEEHGGAVWVESGPGRGSRFWVRLPLPPSTPADGRP